MPHKPDIGECVICLKARNDFGVFFVPSKAIAFNVHPIELYMTYFEEHSPFRIADAGQPEVKIRIERRLMFNVVSVCSCNFIASYY